MPIQETILQQLTDNDPELKGLNLAYQELDHNDIKALTVAAEKNTHLIALNLSGTALTDPSIELLLRLVNLKELELASCQISDSTVDILLGHPSITSLNLSGNLITDLGGTILLQWKQLEHLNLAHNKVGTLGITALNSNVTLKTLDLSYNSLGKNITITLSDNSNVTLLNLAGNGINSHSGTLSGNNLQYLNLSFNQLCDQGLGFLDKVPKLQALDISYNLIKGGSDSLQPILRHPNLHTLFAAFNHWMNDKAICKLSTSRTLTRLDLSGTAIGVPGVYALSRSQLKQLTLNFNELTNTSVVYLSHAKKLSELFMAYNSVSDEGTLALTQKKWDLLDLNYNFISDTRLAELKSDKNIRQFIGRHRRFEDIYKNMTASSGLMDTFLLIIDKKSTIIHFFNPAVSRIMGFSAKQMIGQSIVKFIHPADQKSFYETLQKSTLSRNSSGLMMRFICKDGRILYLQWSLHIEVDLIYAMAIDLTQEKQARFLLEKNQEDELLENKKFNQRLTNLLMDLSHEVRNSMQAMQGLSSLMRQLLQNLAAEKADKNREAIMGEISTCLQDFDDSTYYNLQIVNYHLNSMRIKNDGAEVHVSPLNLTQALKTIQRAFNSKMLEKKLELKFELPKKLLVKADEMRIKQIIINLIINSLKFTNQGSIHVKMIVSNQTGQTALTKITVSDTGIGMDAAELKKLFRRFGQPTSTRSGVGVGMAISKRLAEEMGGTLEIESKKNSGSIFTLSLPLTLMTAAEIAELETKESPNKPVVPKQEIKLKILIVEDNIINQRVLMRHLSQLGHTCSIANNGQEAVDFIRKGFSPVDIITMDIMMPIMDGLEATRQIRAFEKEKGLSRTPIIGTTALEHERASALEAGMDEFITKPYNYQAFANLISKVISEKQLPAKPLPESVHTFSLFSTSSSPSSSSSSSSSAYLFPLK